MKWEYIKYKIRDFSTQISKQKRKKIKDREEDLETHLKVIKDKLDEMDGVSIIEEEEYEKVKRELKEIQNIKTDGVILRCKVRWFEEGEKDSNYFFNLEKHNGVKRHIKKLTKIDGNNTTDPKEILDLEKEFYENLYANKSTKSFDQINSYVQDVEMPSLSEDDKGLLDTAINENECWETLKTFKNNKTPGNDGIPAEFYKKFWTLFSTYMIDSFNETFIKGELSISQKQAIITLLDKKKDRTLLKNWRPISLLNVDYKILSKTISKRLVNILPDLIHCDQAGYVKGRYIGQNIRTIIDLLNYTKTENKPGILISVDFEKAFDSLSWDFMNSVLLKYNFGQNFIKWVNIFYTNVTSCMINNGHTSPYFNIARGVRQGDPLSPYIFILCVEILACKIRQSENIKGIPMPCDTGQCEVKILQYADDSTILVNDEKSILEVFHIIDKFTVFSGLVLNRNKTEAI